MMRLVQRRLYHTPVPKQIKSTHLWEHRGYINGKFTRGNSFNGETFTVTNPANGDVIAVLPRMVAADVGDAAHACMASWPDWKGRTAKERATILNRMASLMIKYEDDLASIITLEAGKPFSEAKTEVAYARSFLEFFAEEATRVFGEILQSPIKGRHLLTMKAPVGPAALITPWNFPSAMITRKLGPAFAAGCPVLIKPSEEAPLSALALCAIAEEAGVPAGVINCLTVAREDTEAVGMAICHSEAIRKVSFTGSTAVGKWLMRESSSTVKKVSLELGGNAPFIVFDDADIEVAARALALSKFRNAGQTCVSSNRVLVQDGIYDKFMDTMVKYINVNAKVGDGFHSSTTIGPLINKKGLHKVHSHVTDCIGKGAVARTGGSPEHSLNSTGGTFYQPTLLDGCTLDMTPFTDETFGPVVPFFRFKEDDEAIRIANDTKYGLAAYACTRDLQRAWKLAEELEYGIIGLNEGAPSTTYAPFGGVKESGLGREGSHHGIEDYLEVKYVCMGLGHK